MEVTYTHCAGLDVHKKTVVACALTPGANGKWVSETRTFGTMTDEVLALGDWLRSLGVTHVAMESTGEYWKPIFNLLEGEVEVLLVNAAHVKNVPGRKTDVKDAQWLAELLQHGLLKASFIPPPPIRELRELTRARSGFVRERVSLVNRVQKVLESANIKLGSVASNVMGASGRAMLEALCAGIENAELMSQLAVGRLRNKRPELERALTGRVKVHHRFILTELLCQIDALDETLARFNAEIGERTRPFEAAVAHLDTIPGVARATAEMIVAEIGVDMSRFPTPDHLTAWAGLAPANHESAGKRLANRRRHGNPTLRKGLVIAAQAVARAKDGFLTARFHRLAARRGRKRALVAIARTILRIAYHLISRDEDYKDLGADYLDRRRPIQTADRLVKRLKTLGFKVTLEPIVVPAAA
jgi:transposase